jgi:hypothetical protein
MTNEELIEVVARAIDAQCIVENTYDLTPSQHQLERVAKSAIEALTPMMQEVVGALLYVENNYDGMNKSDVVKKALASFPECWKGE